MFRSFIKSFLRHTINHRLFSIINILGLAIGLACCLLIALFVQYELSYDRQYANAESIYLVDQVIPGRNDGSSAAHLSSTQLASLLNEEFSEILAAGRYVPFASPVQLESDTVDSSEAEVRYADPGFLKVFDLVWLQGSADASLQTPNEIVLTRELAQKYFGNIDVVGQTLMVDEMTPMRVAGVVEKPPGPTTLDFSALLSVDHYESVRRSRGLDPENWYTALYQTYVLLSETADLSTLQNRFPSFVERHIPPRPEGDPVMLNPLDLTGLYLSQGSSVIDNFQRVLISVAIGFTVLLIAVVNFMNLSTSRASTRALEVSLRQALGSTQIQLIRHFLTEAVIMTSVAMMFALLLAEMLTPFVNGLLGLELSLGAIPLSIMVPVVIVTAVVVGTLAGLYPAFYLSGAEPVHVLHGNSSKGRGSGWLRSSLVICQFTMSIALIVAAVVMYGQLNYLRDLDLGFTPAGKVLITLPNKDEFDINSQWDSLKRQLQQVEGVQSVSYALDSPLLGVRFATGVRLDGNPPVPVNLMPLSHEYLQQYDIDLLAGRYFDGGSTADTVTVQDPANAIAPKGAYILNASAARALEWTPEQAVGRDFQISLGRRGTMYASVVGVAEDTINTGLDVAQPVVYYVPEFIDFYFTTGLITLNVETARMEAFNASITRAWEEYFPDIPLRIRYLDQLVQELYETEERQKRIIGYAALVAVLIACFGLLGLAFFNAEQRRKEVGVRKVMGSSVWRIVLLLTNDFNKLVLISNVIAWPIAYVAMQRWLENFAYRVDLTLMTFIGSGVITLCIASLTVGGIAAKAASRKPVLALRYE